MQIGIDVGLSQAELKLMQESSSADPSSLPRAVRAQSMIGGKPVHPHRVIKDRSNSVVGATSASDKRPALLPLSNMNTENVRGSFDSCIQGGPSALLRIEKNPSTDIDTKEHLRRRIKELEKEVQKLTNHIHQAELSIKNYRVSLSERSPRVGFSNGKDCGMQTDPDDSTALRTSLKSLQDKLQTTTEELRAMKTAKDAMFTERKQLQEVNKRKEDFLTNAVQANEDTITKLTARIRDLETQLATAGIELKQASSPLPTMYNEQEMYNQLLEGLLAPLTETQKLRNDLNTIKSKVKLESQAIMAALTNDYDVLLQAVAQQTSKNNTIMELKITELTSTIKELQTQLEINNQKSVDLHTTCECLQTENDNLLKKLAGYVRETADRYTNTDPTRTLCDASTSTASSDSSPLNTPNKVPLPPVEHNNNNPVRSMMDACASPLSPMANRSANAAIAAAAIQADLDIQHKLRIAERDAEIVDLKRRIDRDNTHLLQQSQDLDALRQRLMSERERYDAICMEQERQLAQRTAQCMNHQLRADNFQQRLGTAAQALAGLQEVHAAEIKAVRHEAHVKDLLRVAKERQADLEKDRLKIELNHNKYVLLLHTMYIVRTINVCSI